MGVFSENVTDLKGIKLHIIPTEKYKTNDRIQNEISFE
jgi:hypothetical protein